MKKVRSLIGMLLVGFACVTLFAGYGFSGEPAVADSTVQKMLTAISANDYCTFVAEGDSTFKAALTKEKFEGVSVQVAPRMAKGYDCSYLETLNQQGCEVYVWKVAYKDGGDDMLVKIVVKDGKIAGFWLE